MRKHKIRFYRPYKLMMLFFALMLIMAFSQGKIDEIASGFWAIMGSRAVLITDFIEVGGFAATLLNVVCVGLFSTFLMMFARVKPNGAIIMAIWLNMGFAFFGKNVYNMLSLTLGVWLYSRVQKQPFMNFTLVSLLSATLSPIVSEISFGGWFSPALNLVLGNVAGIVVGFILPVISTAALRVHEGYQLYNVGFAGGLIAMVLTLTLKTFGLDIDTNMLWSQNYTRELALMLYLIAAGMIVAGFAFGEKHRWKNIKELLGKSGRTVSDFYLQFGDSIFINMGLLCALATTLMLVFRIPLNGPVTGGIMTIMAFGCFGKHIRNVLPVLGGAALCAWLNRFDFYSGGNTLAILFSTGLAPISGQFGWAWGMIAGFLHVIIATNIGVLNSGLNLYNNGFAGAFVALFLVPIIIAFKKDKGHEKRI